MLYRLLSCFAVMLALSACVHVKVDPVKIDATVTIRVDRELNDFFNNIDSNSKTLDVGKTTPKPNSEGKL
jgi:hypothetical protein